MALRRSVNPELALQGLSDGDLWALERLEHLPLASVMDLADCFGRGYTTCYKAFRRLEAAGVVGGADVSVGWRRQRRFWVVDSGAAGTLPGSMWRHSPQLVTRLVENIGGVEAAYRLVAVAVQDGEPERRLQEFRWRRESDVPYDAAARFNDGWMVLLWSGVWQDRASLRSRLERMNWGPDPWGGGANVRPGRYCFLVPDAWQAELVRRATREFGMSDISVVFCLSDRTVSGDFDLARSRGWIAGTRNSEWVAASDLTDVLQSSLLSDDSGRILYRVMTTLEQWPGLNARAVSELSRLNWARVSAALERLEERGLVWRLDHGGYGLHESWLAMAARRDRVWNGRPGKMFGRQQVQKLYAGRIGNHEKGLAALMGRFVQAGCPVAPGWRGVEPMGGVGQLAPDGMVQISEGPFGAGWYYVEYELRARHPTTVGRKLRGYQAELRSDRCPALVVCRPAAVAHFYELGQGLDLLVATVSDARKGPVTGDGGTVWRRFGEPVSVLR